MVTPASPGRLPTLADLSSMAATDNPTREAFADSSSENTLTWREFDDESARAANALRDYAGQKDRIAYLCEASVDHTTMWNGAIKAGCIPSNLHVRASPATTRHFLDSLQPRVLVIDEARSAFVQEHVRGEVATPIDAVITLGEPQAEYEVPMESFLADHDASSPDIRVNSDDVAAIVWTSGTTGRPTGWCLTHRAAVLRGAKLVAALGVERTTRRIQVLSPSFAAWVTGLVPILLTGSMMYFCRDWDAEAYLRAIDDADITMATLVPSMWRELLDLENFDEYDLDSLRRITAAGERLDADTLDRLESRICDTVYNAFAATEVMSTAISNDEMGDGRVESVGKPALWTKVRVVEEGGEPTDEKPPGEIGEVIVKAPDAVAWVWEDTAKTEASFTDGWWYSGDLGYKDEDGYLYLEGRKDFVILSKGIKISPAPIEERLNSHPSVREAAVVGIQDEEYGEKVTAMVQRADADLTPEILDEWCLKSDEMARYERPREYYLVDDPLPRTATNKLDRTAVRDVIDE